MKKSTLAGLSFFALPNLSSASQEKLEDHLKNSVMTVNGPLPTKKMGFTLPHEHLFSTFGAPPTSQPEYDEAKLFAQVVPYLESIKAMGCETIVDCTGAYFGRSPLLLKELSDRTGINILTNTGYYGAAEDKYVPASVYNEHPEIISGRWIKEWEEGIGDTGIRPGFIKLAVDDGPLSEVDSKLVRAGAMTHLRTGLLIVVHTANNQEAARRQLEILNEEAVHPSAWVWAHAHLCPTAGPLIAAARQGAWISLDGLQPSENDQLVEKHLEYLKNFKALELLDRVLLSHDGDAFPSGDAIRPFETLMTVFIPKMKQAGFTDREINLLTRDNPQLAFEVKIKSL